MTWLRTLVLLFVALALVTGCEGKKDEKKADEKTEKTEKEGEADKGGEAPAAGDVKAGDEFELGVFKVKFIGVARLPEVPGMMAHKPDNPEHEVLIARYDVTNTGAEPADFMMKSVFMDGEMPYTSGSLCSMAMPKLSELGPLDAIPAGKTAPLTSCEDVPKGKEIVLQFMPELMATEGLIDVKMGPATLTLADLMPKFDKGALGAMATVGDYDVQVDGIAPLELAKSEFGEYKAAEGMALKVLNVKAVNKTAEKKSLGMPVEFKLLSADKSKQWDSHSECNSNLEKAYGSFFDVEPGATVEGPVCFELPADAAAPFVVQAFVGMEPAVGKTVEIEIPAS